MSFYIIPKQHSIVKQSNEAPEDDKDFAPEEVVLFCHTPEQVQYPATAIR